MLLQRGGAVGLVKVALPDQNVLVRRGGRKVVALRDAAQVGIRPRDARERAARRRRRRHQGREGDGVDGPVVALEGVADVPFPKVPDLFQRIKVRPRGGGGGDGRIGGRDGRRCARALDSTFVAMSEAAEMRKSPEGWMSMLLTPSSCAA